MNGFATKCGGSGWVLLLSAALLSACGGGSGGSATPPPVAKTLTLNGTASTGTLLASAAVEAKCATGTGNASTSASGNYTLAISEGVLPCALRVKLPSGAALHSLANGGGDSATANLSPLTELVVARLAGGMPTSYYDGYGATSVAAQTVAATTAATTAVVQTLKEGGVDVSAAGDPLTATIAAGSAQAQALDNVNTALAAGQATLADLTTAVAQTSAAASATSLTAALPAAQLLQPAAANCSALRSGRYRLVVNEANPAGPSTQVITFDVAKMTVTNSSNEVFPIQANGNCAYKAPASGGELQVTKAGVIVGRVGGIGTGLSGAIFFPEQSHTLAELAGDWNALGFDSTAAKPAVHLTSGTATLDGAGKLTAITQCDDLHNCATASPPITFTANAAGGFDMKNTVDNWSNRVFAYRAGGGELMLVITSGGGSISVLTRKATVAMPALGWVREGMDLTLTPQYAAPYAMSPYKGTVTAVDIVAGSYARSNVVNFSTVVTRPETMLINKPRDGYIQRPSATGVTLSDGSTGNVSEFIGLSLRGMDLLAAAVPASNVLLLSAQAAQ